MQRLGPTEAQVEIILRAQLFHQPQHKTADERWYLTGRRNILPQHSHSISLAKSGLLAGGRPRTRRRLLLLAVLGAAAAAIYAVYVAAVALAPTPLLTAVFGAGAEGARGLFLVAALGALATIGAQPATSALRVL